MKLIIYTILGVCLSSNLQATEMLKECPLTKFNGFYKTKDLTDTDLLCYKTAQRRCGELYPKSPCLKVFSKTGEYSYTAICGAIRK